MDKRVLVIGATSIIGQAVARQLKKDGYNVRVMSRNQIKARSYFKNGFEIYEADIFDSASLSKAFKEVNFVYLNLPEKHIVLSMSNIIDHAKNARVKQIGYTSGCTVKKESSWNSMIRSHYWGESILMSSGIPFSIFRLTLILDLIPRFANKGEPCIFGKQPYSWSWVYSGDVAKMVSKAFELEEARNKKFTLFGPDKISMFEAVDRFNAVFYPNAKPAKPKPFWMADLLDVFVCAKLKCSMGLFQYFENHPEEGDPNEANQLLGKPQTGIGEFIELYKNKIDPIK